VKTAAFTPDLFADELASAAPTTGATPAQATPQAARLATWQPEAWPVAPDWKPLVDAFITSPTGEKLAQHIRERLSAGATIYPPQPLRALELTALKDARVVILGQDPYHGPGQAEGLAFSVPTGIKPPPSLRNIFKELQREGFAPPANGGSLQAWAEQGVLLLNTCLTVEDGQPASHAKRGWEVLTDSLIQACSDDASPKVFLLWGAHAQAKRTLIDQQRHCVLTANHPSPLSALRPPEPFMGCDHFAKVNDFLTAQQRPAIRWGG
jgi:uracil-DNA glycosylase